MANPVRSFLTMLPIIHIYIASLSLNVFHELKKKAFTLKNLGYGLPSSNVRKKLKLHVRKS